jgi:hypothetical protein
VASVKLRGGVGVAQAFACVLANRLEHVEARLAVGPLLLSQQVVLKQRLELVEAGVANGLGRVEAAAAGEHGEALEQTTAVLSEQAIAPVDRAA